MEENSCRRKRLRHWAQIGGCGDGDVEMEDVTREDGSRGGIFKIRVALKCDSVSQRLLSLVAQSLSMAGSWQDVVLRCEC